MNERRQRRITLTEVAAFLGVSQQQASRYKAAGKLGEPHLGRFDIEAVRRFSQERIRESLDRCRELESAGMVHVESVAAALACSVDLVIELCAVTYAGAGRRLVHRTELERLRSLISPTQE